jgi:hypothetical protein
MAEIIQFPIKTKPQIETPTTQKPAPEPPNPRRESLRNTVQTIARGFENKTHDLVYFYTDAKKVADTAHDIELLEPRVIVVHFDRLNVQKRTMRYRYPVCHVIVMSHQIARKDRNILEQIAEQHRVLLVREEKQKITVSKYHTKKDHENWKKERGQQ